MQLQAAEPLTDLKSIIKYEYYIDAFMNYNYPFLNLHQVMRSTIHTNPLQPTHWSPVTGMLACIAEFQYSLDSGTGSPKLGFEKNTLTKEAGR